jgi:SAM-dependent methyltransferase
VALLRAAYRCADVVVLPGQLRQAYLHCWRAWPSPYAASSSSSDPSSIYGESFVVVARRILRKHGCSSGSDVVDLGCGRGNVVVAAVSLGAVGRGVDVVAGHVDVVAGALAVVGGAVVVGDAREFDVAGASHVWLSWATWDAELRASVVANLRRLRSGAVVVGVVHGVEADGFVVVDRLRAAFSWGFADVVVSRRV